MDTDSILPVFGCGMRSNFFLATQSVAANRKVLLLKLMRSAA